MYFRSKRKRRVIPRYLVARDQMNVMDLITDEVMERAAWKNTNLYRRPQTTKKARKDVEDEFKSESSPRTPLNETNPVLTSAKEIADEEGDLSPVI